MFLKVLGFDETKEFGFHIMINLLMIIVSRREAAYIYIYIRVTLTFLDAESSIKKIDRTYWHRAEFTYSD